MLRRGSVTGREWQSARSLGFRGVVSVLSRVSSVVSLLCVCMWASCSSNTPNKPRGDATARDGSGGNGVAAGSASAGHAGAASGAGAGASNAVAARGAAAAGGSAGGAATGGAPQEQACAETAEEAQRIPVDMYIMLDRSGSMTEATGAGPTKWDAMRSALETFLGDSRSAGLGVGLQFFPLRKPGVPEECTTNEECGPGGPCLNGVCRPRASAVSSLTACAVDADCPADTDGCAPKLGRCSLDSSTLCFGIGESCGLFRGSCQEVVVTGPCGGIDSCEAAEYAKPAVAIDVLPRNAASLITTLQNETTIGRTPTAGALSGALQHAKAYGMSHPLHRVVAVLATDGLPTECEPLDAEGVGDLASAAFKDKPGTSTYVVGVFASGDTVARDNLNDWAAAGGTEKAFIVDPSQDVAAQFLDALDKIRSGSIACEYQLPKSESGVPLDFDRVNVALVEGSQTRNFLYVSSEARCSATELGWYYDVDPSKGTPTKITVCPSGCETLKATDSGRVEVRVGCKTIAPD